ncbi:MAG: DUF188 domain-containing protein [Clostridium sp.]|nr:DUF188 domain-containing protein [Clostridium sp.]
MVKILIDGDACSKISETIEVAKENNMPVDLYHDTTSYFDDDYITCHVIDKGRDMVDFAIVNHVEKGDIVITDDGGLACMVLAKGGNPMNAKGIFYTEKNIDSFLTSRHLTASTRRKSGRNKVSRVIPKQRKYDFKKSLAYLIILSKKKLAG